MHLRWVTTKITEFQYQAQIPEHYGKEIHKITDTGEELNLFTGYL